MSVYLDKHSGEKVKPLKFQKNDGGRSEAGFKGLAGDCTTRAIAIVTGKSYREVYNALNSLAKEGRQTKHKKRSSARDGVHRTIYDKYLKSLGYEWTATMKIGTGCKVHLREGELPNGRLIVRVSKHMTSVVDGVIHDTHDPSRGGVRCVYGYWSKK